MWNRTKRLVNSYLDDLINRVSGPDREVREVTRAEVVRLNELEVQTQAAGKMLEKELAEIELKIIGIGERRRMAQERADEAGASRAGAELENLSAQRDLVKQQIGEAKSAAARARSLREERRQAGEDLANDTHLTSMRENLAAIQSPLDPLDPAGTIEEMRGRLRRPAGPTDDELVAQADRELEAERNRTRVEDMLSRYKQTAGLDATQPTPMNQPAPTVQPGAGQRPTSIPPNDAGPEESQSKTLGRTDGPIRPID